MTERIVLSEEAVDFIRRWAETPVTYSVADVRQHLVDTNKRTYCLICQMWEPRYGIVCAHCGHSYYSPGNLTSWADHMERAGYPAVPEGHCPLCGEAMT